MRTDQLPPRLCALGPAYHPSASNSPVLRHLLLLPSSKKCSLVTVGGGLELVLLEQGSLQQLLELHVQTARGSGSRAGSDSVGLG